MKKHLRTPAAVSLSATDGHGGEGGRDALQALRRTRLLATFRPTKSGAMVMGDTVVFQDEVTPAMDAAFAGNLEVTGLHNHFFL